MTKKEIVTQSGDALPITADWGGPLISLEILNVGPGQKFRLDASRRLNVITGDNGLGKSFLLDVAWWALTETWAQSAPYPDANSDPSPSKILFEVTNFGGVAKKFSATYDGISSSEDKWKLDKIRTDASRVAVFAQIDGSIAVSDPFELEKTDGAILPRRLNLNLGDIWQGYSKRVQEQNRSVINGMISDLVNWQRSKDKTQFNILSNTLKRLSPALDGDLGLLELGEPQRIPNDAREIPTIKHSYSEVPITLASAGVKRILSLAYILVWAWTEHLVKAKLSGRISKKQLVIVIDEIEAHLHPKWQRLILPALLKVGEDLSSESGLEIQFFVTTHSPLVLASLESVFDDKTDSLFHLDIDKQRNVVLEEIQFDKYGTVDDWLTSDVFELAEARSVEGEKAIEEAKRVMDSKPPKKDAILRATEQLRQTLPNTDVFYPRWAIFASRHGVEI